MPKAHPDKYVLFDFDGVIADSFDIGFETKKHFHPDITPEEWRTQFEGNIFDFVKELEKESEAGMDDRVRRWFEFYVPLMEHGGTIFPGMKEAVFYLETQYRLIIISSTIDVPIKDLLVKFGLFEHFDEVMGADTHRSKIEKMKMVQAKFGCKAEDCIFVTDTLGDMREARHMAIDAIGVTWGFHQRNRLEKGDPFALVDTPKELTEAIDRYFFQDE